MTLNYSRLEIGAAIRFTIGVTVVLSFTKTFAVFIFKNSTLLPINYHIFGLPVYGTYSVNWTINYFYQLLASTSFMTFFLSYYPINMIMINHSCWIIDSAKLSVHELNDILSDGVEPSNFQTLSLEIFQQHKKIIKNICKIIEYQRKTQKLLQLILFGDIFSLAVISCFGFKSLIDNSDKTVGQTTGLLINLWQLFAYCLMGSRVKTRIKKLADLVYGIRWDKCTPKQRRDLQVTLLMCQSLKGFHGIFKPLDLATYQSVRNRLN